MEKVQLFRKGSSESAAQTEGGKAVHQRSNEASLVWLIRQISL